MNQPDKQLPSFAEIRRTDIVFLTLTEHYRDVMATYELTPFATQKAPVLAAYEHRKYCTYDIDVRQKLMQDLMFIHASIVNRGVELVLEGKMALPEDKRTRWTKVKDFFKSLILGSTKPIEVLIRQKVRKELAKRSDPNWAE